MSKAEHFGLLRTLSICSSIILFSESFSRVKTSRIKQFYLVILLFFFKDSKCTKFGFSLLVFYVYHFLFNGFKLFISFFKISHSPCTFIWTLVYVLSVLSLCPWVLYVFIPEMIFSQLLSIALHFFPSFYITFALLV